MAACWGPFGLAVRHTKTSVPIVPVFDIDPMPNANGRLDAIRGIGRSHASVFQSCKDLDSDPSAVLTNRQLR